MAADADILVVGGGIAGATAAVALAEQGWSVVVLDSGPAPEPVHADDAPLIRVSTLNPAVRNILERLDVWRLLPQSRIGELETMRVWEDQNAELVFSAADAGLARLGNVVENESLKAALWQRLAGYSNVELRPDQAARRVDSNERRVRVTLDDSSRVSGQLLVAADGANSPVRGWSGIEVTAWDYGQKGLVLTVTTDEPHQNTAWQRFLTEGPLAFLPLPANQSSIVWTLPAGEADSWLECSDDELEIALEREFESRLGGVSISSSRGAFPLTRRSANQYFSQRMVLLGDAAHVVHPLAGQGANLGLLDAAALAELLQSGLERGLNPADPQLLRRYERWRRSDVEIMAESLHQLWFLYRWRVPPFPAARRFGSRFISRNRWLRRRLIDHASGFGGRVPVLARRQSQ